MAAFLPAIATAQQSLQAPEPKDWGFSLTPYLWLTNVRTDINNQVIRGSVDQLASLTNSALMVIGTARWRRWSVAVDGFSSNIGQTNIYGPIEIGVALDQKIVTSKVGYRFLDSRNVGGNGGTELWAFVGARSWTIKPIIDYTWNPIIGNDPPTTDDYSVSDVWWDPLVGTRAHFEVTPVVHFFVRGNIGGFGIGDASTFTWDIGAYSSFRFWDHVALHAGFQWLAYDRTTGEGLDEVSTKYNMHGLFMGASWIY